MNKRELEQKLVEVNAQMKALGDLNALVQQSQNLPNLVSDIQTKRTDIDSFLSNLPTRINELSQLTIEINNLTEQVVTREKQVAELNTKTEELQKRMEGLIVQTEVQLGVAANAKLASTFEQVKDRLSGEKNKTISMACWGSGTSCCLHCVRGLVAS